MVPFGLVEGLLAEKEHFQDVELLHIHTLGPMPWVDAVYDGHFRPNSFFLSRKMCEAVEDGRADYTPCATYEVPRLFRSGVIALDVALVQVSPPDEAGYVSLGLSADVICAAVKSAKVVVGQINSQVPQTYGDTRIRLKALNYVLEKDAELPTMTAWDYDEHHVKIGEYAAQLIEDGSTLQASMGNSPQAVLRALHKHQNLGLHTGCFTDEMMRLMQNGVVNNSSKNMQHGLSVASHCLGSDALYDFVRENKEIELHKSEWANDPHRIAKNKRMVSINGAREIDLTGQVVRDSRGHRFYGGIGATQDFIRGAAMSEGGRPIIALASRDGDGSSRIVTGLTSGSGVCSSRGDVHYVVTEYGVANLVGQSIRQRVLRLVEIAHPDAREGLLMGAREQGWIPKIYGFKPSGIHDRDAGIDSKLLEYSGINYMLRPLHPSDLRSLQEFFYAQDEETIRLRYGHAIPVLDEGSAYRMTSVDQSKDLAIGVFYRDNHRELLRAVGRFYLDANGESAEVAFLVHEKARRMGVANSLLSEIAEIAQARGVKRFWASVLKRNEPMVRLFMSRGAERERIPGEDSDEFFMEVDTLVEQSKSWRKKQASKKARKVAKKPRKKRKIGVWSSAYMLQHDTGDRHPESAVRYQHVMELLDKEFSKLPRIADRRATTKEITLVHSGHYHDIVRWDAENFAEQLRTGDTALCEESYTVAMQATGAVLAAVDEVVEGKLRRVFCAVRPPGHHANRDRGMGFCLFNHVAVAARYAQQKHGLKRVAVLDWDVHHGNGTQDIFYDDASVLFFSTHEEGLFPYTGLAEETGDGEGVGLTINVPMPKNAGDYDMLQAWGQPLEQALDRFQPQLIILSAGFDAAQDDPLADMQVSVDGFAKLTELVRDYADRFCKGRLISVMEGGYEPQVLADCVRAHLKCLP